MLDPTEARQAADIVMAFVVCCILGIGLAATLWGKFTDWRYGSLMSSDDDEPTAGELVRENAVPVGGSRLYQVNGSSEYENVPEREPPTEHNDAALIAQLATLKDSAGKYRFSANKIADLVGGTRADVLAEIAAHRPRPASPKANRRLERPANGW